MRAAYRTRASVEPDDVHHVTHTDLLARECRGGPQASGTRFGGVEEQLRGVVPGFAMDLHEPREVGRTRIVKPVVVREPRVAVGDEHEVAGSRMVQPVLRLAGRVEHLVDSGQLLAQRPYR